MGKLTDDEDKVLAQLLAKKEAPDAPEPEGEVWESPDGTFGAKLRGAPFTDWLRKKGILDDDEEVAEVQVSNKPGGSDEAGKDGTVRAFGRTIRKTS